MEPLPIRLVDELDINSLRPSALHHLSIAVVEDGLGRPLRLPVVVAKGRRPGPTFGLTAALHGNELNGIPVMHELFSGLEPSRIRGAVVGVLAVNVPGMLEHQRGYLDGRDLNHLFPGKEDGATSPLFAHRVFERIVSKFNYLVDLHTASFGRVNCLYVRADLEHEVAADMARRLRPQILLHNPASDHTLRGAAMEQGIPAVTLEIGNPHAFNERYIKQSVVGIRGVLGQLGLTARRRVALGMEPIVCSGSDWFYTQRGGLLRVAPRVTDRVTRGQLMATLTNIYGDVTEEFRAPRDGIVIGHSVQPVGAAGARIAHLGWER